MSHPETTVRSVLQMYMPSLYQGDEPSPTAIEGILLWPPDVFALTAILLEETGIYRLVVSPPGNETWPPHAEWTKFARETGWRWQDQLAEDACPSPVRKLLEAILESADTTLTQLRHDPAGNWRLCKAILSLNAIADEACVNVGLPEEEENVRFLEEAKYRLTTAGTLAKNRLRWATVLPKLRTPQVGITSRSMSMHVALDRSEVEVNWDVGGLLKDHTVKKLNVLLLPWPLKIRATDFKAVPGHTDEHHYFDYSPEKQKISTKLIGQLIEEAKDEVGDVSTVIMPELALSKGQLNAVKGVLKSKGVPGLLAGTRDKHRNYAHLARIWGEGDEWRVQEQNKHHRWCIDESQIRQYHIGTSLHPSKRWWESIDVKTRNLNFLAVNDWLTMCTLICEDLARTEPGLETIRAVGPTLVVALLLDGPQLQARWPGRYASVLADDPGSSVLSMTALGMAERSRPNGMPPCRVIALWKDAQTGSSQIELEPGAKGVVLTLCAEFATERTADGRSDGGAAGVLSLAGVHQVGKGIEC